jgi:hypothetical protein
MFDLSQGGLRRNEVKRWIGEEVKRHRGRRHKGTKKSER